MQASSPRHHYSLRLLAFFLAMLICLGFSQSSHAAKVHIVLAGDTLDPSVGNDVQTDLETLERDFKNWKFDGVRIRVIRDRECTPGNILRALDNLRIQPEDTVFFYYSGHGARDPVQGDFLDMPRLGARGQLLRSEIQSRMNQWLNTRQMRLGVIITDSCNQLTVLPPQLAPAANAREGARNLLLEALLLYSSGLLDINSADIDQIALSIPPARGIENPKVAIGFNGGIFTSSFKSMLIFNEDVPMDWNTFLNGVQDDMSLSFKHHFPNGVITPTGKRQLAQTIKRISIPVTNIPPNIKDNPPPGGGGGNKDGYFLESIGVTVARKPVQKFDGVNRNRWGVRITDVDVNAPIHQFWHADDVILSVDGRETRNFSELELIIKQARPEPIAAWWKASIGGVVRGESIKLKGRPAMPAGNPNPVVNQQPMPVGKVFSGDPKKLISEKLGIKLESGLFSVATPTGSLQGVRIQSVRTDSFAEGWLDPGDVILRVNGRTTSTIEEFHEAIETANNELAIFGFNSTNNFVSDFMPFSLSKKAPKQSLLGVLLENEIASIDTTEGVRKGVKIAVPLRNTPSDNGLLEPGDIILEVNGKPTPTIEDFQQAVDQAGNTLNIIGVNVRTKQIETFRPIPLNR
jgi:S1-C subfamily serine protease